MNCRGLVFDLDGTLLDTLAGIAAAFNAAIDTAGYPTHPVDAYRYFIGDGAGKCMERCLPDGVDNATVDRCLALHRQYYADTWHEGTRAYEGIPELLEYLDKNAFKLAVLSNKDDVFTRQCITHFFPQVDFDAIIGYSASVPHKPHPAGGQMIAAKFDAAPREIVYVGDSGTDMKTARACNMPAVGVLWGFRDERELVEAGADRTISRPEELLGVIGAGH